MKRSVVELCAAEVKSSVKASGGRQMKPALMQREQTSQCWTSPLQNGGQIVELFGSSCLVRFQGMGIPGSV